MLATVKKALRISHNALDDDITREIAVAKADMVRAGVSPYMVQGATDALVQAAIITFIKASHAPDQKVREGFEKSYAYQLDALRKSNAYRLEDGDTDV